QHVLGARADVDRQDLHFYEPLARATCANLRVVPECRIAPDGEHRGRGDDARRGRAGLGRTRLGGRHCTADAPCGGPGSLRLRVRRPDQQRCPAGLAGVSAALRGRRTQVASRLPGPLDAAGHHRAVCAVAAGAAHAHAHRGLLAHRPVRGAGVGGAVRNARFGRATNAALTRNRNPFDRFARLYDWEHDRYLADVEVHLAFAARFGGPVLELACGSGRLLAPLAQAGFRATGVDSSSAMLERARQRLDALGVQAQLVEQMFFYDEQDQRGYLKRSMVELRLRWFTRFELELLLQAAGWQVEEVYGGYDLAAYGPQSERLLVVAR